MFLIFFSIQFYLKARGLTDAITNRFMTLNAESLKIEKLAEILKNMKMPIKTSTPLHLEFIVQYEGKAVLSYHLNQTSFLALTDGDRKDIFCIFLPVLLYKK